MVTLVKEDLSFILRQIEIAEAHASGTPLTQLVDSPLLPFGLRTVDGSYNNIVSGREQYGVSGKPFTFLAGGPSYGNDQDGDTMYLGPTQPVVTNTDYGAPGSVADADPRIISNLIVDQTPGNPAAVRAALQLAGLTGSELAAAEAEIRAAYEATKITPADVTLARAALDSANDQLLAALEALDAIPLTDTDAIAAANLQIDALFLARTEAQADLAAAQTALTQADSALAAALEEHGVEMSGDSIVLPNVAPDEGLSAPYNSWFTLFGQFFDHGLDLVQKGGNGTVYIPLQKDDPLYVEGAHTNFMAVTRTPDADAANVTTPWVDQNQTYTSHPSHQVFLREYKMLDGKPVATGNLLNGENGGLATWGDVKAQAREMLGIDLTDADVGMVPLILTDPYGKFIPSAAGFAQVAFSVANGDGTFTMEYRSGTPDAPLSLVGAARTPNAFLDDIAHDATPVFLEGELQRDADDAIGYAGGTNARGQNTAYDNEMLDAHFATGDGRGNENIGLTAVHHVFHAEHNRLVEHVKDVVLASGDLEFLNSWLLQPVTAIPADGAGLEWNGERLFQAARFTTEMQYQHLVFEEFARKIQPDIDVFMVQPNVELDPAIFAEFAHVVYRFGHSMLNETVDRIGEDGQRHDMTLFKAFLNPPEFNLLDGTPVSAEVGAGAIIRGMTGQVGNEIDEFVTDALRNNLLGLPLDLAAINIARARETGMPTLNEARATFRDMAGGDTQLDPYTSWSDFALNLRNPASIVNFIAAYGTHDSITGATTLEAKRAAALKLVMGGTGAPADRLDFLNARGEYAKVEDPSLGGLQNVDFWVGGLAEKKMAFGGMLGSTFSFVFELQMENLQNADRFYYLSRTQGMNLLTELENNSLAKIIQRNTDLGETGFALPADVFSTPDFSLYVDADKQADFGHADPTHDDPILEALSSKVERGDNYIRFNGLEHVVIAGTEDDDTIISGGGDDGVWGFGGNDRIEAGYGVDKIMGGDGDDIITNAGTDIGETDMLHGDDGNDVIQGGSGLSLIFGGKGQDAILMGPDGSEARGGTGSDFILGREGADASFGNEGDDWVEAGAGFDYIAGDNGDIFFNSPIIGHDVLNGGSGDTDYDGDSGDDIMFAGEGIQKLIGMWGFDWAIHKGQQTGANADMNIGVFPNLPLEVLRDRFSQVEAVSGWDKDDVLRGDDRIFDTNAAGDPTPEGNFINNELSQAGVERIVGLRTLLGTFAAPLAAGAAALETDVAFARGNILLGGGGSDTIEGRGGDDVIDGDAWLDVRIRVSEDRLIDSLAEIQDELLSGTINPGQLSIVREIRYNTPDADAPEAIDIAVYSDLRANYTITENNDGSWIVAHSGGAGLDGTDLLRNIEMLQFADGLFALEADVPLVEAAPDPGPLPGLLIQMRAALEIEEVGTPVFVNVAPSAYTGPVQYLEYEMIGTQGRDIVFGTDGNDFINVGAGTDAVDGGAGDDVIDGGTGSNFLSGGAGNDVFFIDGRGGGAPTWSTITDWAAGDQLAIWGWAPGTSKLFWQDNAGAEGYTGATLHADLDNNGSIDVSVTWAGVSQGDLPSPVAVASDQLLWFV